MKLTIAMRIIGGFALVTLLLLLSGALSLLSINTVSVQTDSFKSFSLPMKDLTSQIEQKIGTEQLTLHETFYANTNQQLRQFGDQLALEQQGLDNSLTSLLQLIQGRDALTTQVEQLKNQYRGAKAQISALIEARKLSIDTEVKLNNTLSEMEVAIDDTSSLLLDVMDLEYSELASEQALAATANSVDNQLASLISTAQELRQADTHTKVKTISGELEYMVNNLALLKNDLVKGPEMDLQEGLLEEIKGYLDATLSHLNETNGVVALRQQILTANQQAKTALDLSQVEFSAINSQLGELNLEVVKISDAADSAISNSLTTSKNTTLIVIVLSVIVAATVAFFTIRAITRPLGQVNQALEVLAQGDLTRKLDYKREDEFGRLVDNTNTLVDNLRSLIVAIVDRSNQLAAAAEQTSAVTAQTTSGIQEQRSQVDQVASATTELSASATQVAAGANDALGEIKSADDETQQVQKLSSENGATIQSLASEVERAARVINKLDEDSAAIGGILDVIRGIADQTNLLALNAAIEAARAGEQGRGFAVVADEVRSLASRTQDSTAEIQQMIEVLQQGAKEAVTVMEQGQLQAKDSVDKTAEANQMLATIVESVGRVYEAGNQIAQAAQEQDKVSRTISERLEQIAGIAEETSGGALQTASSSEEVAKLADELQGQVRQFKV